MSNYSFLWLPDTSSYKDHFVKVYCQSPLPSRHGLQVRFSANKFEHAFYESTNRDGKKDQFSTIRAQRMDRIKTALIDPEADWFQGWESKKKQYTARKAVCVVQEDFVTVLKLTNSGKANFVTCYQADNSISKIRSSPLWLPPAMF